MTKFISPLLGLEVSCLVSTVKREHVGEIKSVHGRKKRSGTERRIKLSFNHLTMNGIQAKLILSTLDRWTGFVRYHLRPWCRFTTITCLLPSLLINLPLLVRRNIHLCQPGSVRFPPERSFIIARRDPSIGRSSDPPQLLITSLSPHRGSLWLWRWSLLHGDSGGGFGSGIFPLSFCRFPHGIVKTDGLM